MTRRKRGVIIFVAACHLLGLGLFALLGLRSQPTVDLPPDAGVSTRAPGIPGQGLAYSNALHKSHVENDVPPCPA